MKVFFFFSPSCLALHLPGSCSCTALWVPLLHFLPINPIYICLYFFIPPLFPVGFFLFFSVLKQAHRGERHTVFECVLTLCLHKAWFPPGKLAFGMFTFCSHVGVASKNKQNKGKKKKRKEKALLSFSRRAADKTFYWGKTDADPSFKPKEEGERLVWADKNKNCLGRQQRAQPAHRSVRDTPCVFTSVFVWLISIHSRPLIFSLNTSSKVRGTDHP